jgi:tripartite-type tricarboxylate transporter receptor subunit TctC
VDDPRSGSRETSQWSVAEVSRVKVIASIVSCCAVALLLEPCFGQTGSPQAWPSKPVRLVVPYAPGGAADITARLIGKKLTEFFGQPVIVENRAGAGGNIGTALVAKAASDGYTVLVTVSAIVVNVSLFPNAGYDAERDFIPIVVVARQPALIVVNAKSPAKTLAELLSLAKASKLSFATPGSGTPPHLIGLELFNRRAKLDMKPIHYRGAGPAVAALLAREPPVGVLAAAAPLPYVAAGWLRALAVSSSRRIEALPGVPTLAESGFPGLQDYLWIGVFAPSRTPPEIVQKLNESLNRAIQSPDVRKRLETQAFETVGGSLQQTAEYVRAESVRWAKIVRDTGAKPY